MTRTESLADLATWAAATATKAGPPYVYPPDKIMGAAAIRHGAAAVRAIREDASDPPWSCTPEAADYAISESRLAFRCALRAVGLRTL